MTSTTKHLRMISTLLMLISSLNNCYSQAQKKEVLVKYINTDTLQLNRNCVLILYKDNSYLNYGLFINSIDKEWYVWYSSGRWINNDSKFLLKSYDQISNSDLIIKEILADYKKRPDYTLIEKYYEFVNLNYEDYILEKKEANMLDVSKKINYRPSKL